ncbi:putative disease resistance protein RGA4 [Carex rostrata]
MELALSTVAQWAGSAIITKLVDTAYSYLGKLPADTEFKAQLRRLETALPQIAAVMGVAEVLKFKYPNSGVDKWLVQFREAFFAAEDVLDDIKYRELENKVNNQDQVCGSSSSTVLPLVKKKICSLKKKISGSSNSKDILKRLRGVVENLDQVAAGVGNFFQFTNALDFHGHANPNNQHVNTSSRETTSFLTESEVFGRENEKAMIIEWLKKPASHGNISAFCIVGLGGLGKTTLAQLISEEIKKENHFDQTIWVCVSTIFNAEDIIRKILQGLGEECHHNESLDLLQIKLKEKIFSKKILFILDDVWNDDKISDWEKLIPLKFGQQGSKILLTTRMKSVAEMLARVLKVDQECKVLEGLEEQQLLLLLNTYAFHGYNPDKYRNLQNIGKDVVKKLWGSPLAAKVIGCLLNSNMNVHYWNKILNHDSLINLEQAKDVVDVLKLSYYHLPAHLQECFRFCCIFPQDYQFNKNELIKMWMTSGFIHKELHAGESSEDIGEEYFNHLLRKSFFQQQAWGNNIYVMHDLIHDLAQNVSKGECCRIEINGKSDIIPSTLHVSIHESELERVCNLKNLRTLIINWSEDHINRGRFVPPKGSLKETLRLLVIEGEGRCELPEEIGSLLHLRFLKVDRWMGQSNKWLLPNSIYKLYHLQVLEMPSWDEYMIYEGGVETTGLTNLVSLCYMKIPNPVMRTFNGLHKLTSLQELDFFVGRDSGPQIDELQMLNNLRSLSIWYLENVGNPVEAMNANLSKKENLISLSLSWTKVINSENNHEQVIDNLRPHPSLKKLTITGYSGHKSPIWMRGSSHLYLLSLTLQECPLWESLPSLGQMPYLKELSLYSLDDVKEMDYSCDSASDCAFPSLERLVCNNMPKWKCWTGAHSSYGFPNLIELEIKDCPNLTKLPDIPFSLLAFEVYNVGLNSLPDMHHGSSITSLPPSCMKSSVRVVRITKCPKLIALNGFMQQQNLDLQAIEELTIEDCENLVQLPTGAFGNFVSLKLLCIKGIQNMVTVDNQTILLPVKLETLKMGNCGELDVSLLESASQVSTLTTLGIRNSANITSIPFSENAFTKLTRLTIYGCDKLIELSSMQQAHTVNPGNNLFSLKITDLDIDDLRLLLIEPCRSLRFVRSLEVMKCSGMEALPEQWLLQNSSTLQFLGIEDASSLRSLPSTMVMLTALKSLYILKATLLKEIPELPISLIHKGIANWD